MRVQVLHWNVVRCLPPWLLFGALFIACFSACLTCLTPEINTYDLLISAFAIFRS